MAILDVLKFQGPTEVLVWKWESDKNKERETQIRLGSQLIVNESQEAIFFKGGKALDVFGPGTHTLSTKNLPVLSTIIGAAFGGNSPFSAEVFFVNKATAMNVLWGLLPFNMTDPTLSIPFPVTARGSFAIKVMDSRTFITEIVGTEKMIDAHKIKDKFKGIITEQVKTGIIKFAKAENLSPVDLEGIVSDVSTSIRTYIGQSLEKYGLSLDMFVIEAIPIIDDDPRIKQLLDQLQQIRTEDLQEKLRLKRRAENLEVYKTERQYDTTEAAAQNMGGSMGGDGLLGTIVGVGAAASVGGQLSGLMAGAINVPNTIGQKCSNCSGVIPQSAGFCPSCGNKAQAQNLGKFCSQCGSQLTQDVAFCPNCGNRLR